MLQDLALGPDSVDVSMETLASVWAPDPCVLTDPGENGYAPSTAWGECESQCVFSPSPPAGQTWTEQFSPHLQRNRQLHDTLLQREEELAQLQEENNKLREFLSSSFVRNLQEKAKKLTTDGRRQLKRSLMHVDDDPLHSGHRLLSSKQVSKRICRNLTVQFCSEDSETSTSSEPNLDLWVLRTLGLKDRDTIDLSEESLSSSGQSLRSLVYDTAVGSSSPPSSESSFSSFSHPAAISTPYSYCQTSTQQPGFHCSPAQCQEASCISPAGPAQNCTPAPGQHSNITARPLTAQYESPETVIRSYNSSNALQSPNGAQSCSIPAFNPALRPVNWSPVETARTTSQDTIPFSPPGGSLTFSPVLSSSPTTNHHWTPVQAHRSPASPSAGSQPPVTPQTPRSRTDLAFRMSLSPSSSVKTHSFPQGQAFVSKDTEGKWNFTWLPRQRP